MQRLIACFHSCDEMTNVGIRSLQANCKESGIRLAEYKGYLFASGSVGAIMLMIGQMQADGYETLCSVEDYTVRAATLVGLV